MRVTEFEAERRFGFETTSGPMHESVRWTFSPSEEGSHVTMSLRLTPTALGMRLMEPLMRPSIKRAIRSNTGRMRELLDAEGSTRT